MSRNRGDADDEREDFPVAVTRYIASKGARAADKATESVMTAAATKAINDLIFKGRTDKGQLEPVARQAAALEEIARVLGEIRTAMAPKASTVKAEQSRWADSRRRFRHSSSDSESDASESRTPTSPSDSDGE